MKVRLTTSRAGYGFEQSVGDVIELADVDASLLIARGQAEPVANGENAAELLPGRRGRKGRKVERR